jgi:hypothetical protein
MVIGAHLGATSGTQRRFRATRGATEWRDLLHAEGSEVLAERWRVYYNTERPHSSLGYRPPAPAAWQAKTNKGHGEVETAARFPLLHTPDGDGLTNSSAALH